MKIPTGDIGDQYAKAGKHRWCVSRLIELSRKLPIMKANINHINIYAAYEKLTLREMVMHVKAVNDADLDCPIILDEDGEVLDGRHRIMKAILEGRETIKAVRFDENPPPCNVDD